MPYKDPNLAEKVKRLQEIRDQLKGQDDIPRHMRELRENLDLWSGPYVPPGQYGGGGGATPEYMLSGQQIFPQPKSAKPGSMMGGGPNAWLAEMILNLTKEGQDGPE